MLQPISQSEHEPNEFFSSPSMTQVRSSKIRSLSSEDALDLHQHHLDGAVEDDEESRVENEDDIVWVIVIRGRQTSLSLFALEWIGSLVSFSLVVDAGLPTGSGFIFAVNLLTFATAGLFLAPPFLKRMPARYRESTKSRALVLFAVAWAAFLSVLAFSSAVVASREFVECHSLSFTGQCSRIQAGWFCLYLFL